jgi:hypothetical protein
MLVLEIHDDTVQMVFADTGGAVQAQISIDSADIRTASIAASIADSAPPDAS